VLVEEFCTSQYQYLWLDLCIKNTHLSHISYTMVTWLSAIVDFIFIYLFIVYLREICSKNFRDSDSYTGFALASEHHAAMYPLHKLQCYIEVCPVWILTFPFPLKLKLGYHFLSISCGIDYLDCAYYRFVIDFKNLRNSKNWMSTQIEVNFK